MKYSLYKGSGPKKQDSKDHFLSRCLFSVWAASQILEIRYLVDFLYKLSVLSALEGLLWLIPVKEYDMSVFWHVVSVRLVFVLI